MPIEAPRSVWLTSAPRTSLTGSRSSSSTPRGARLHDQVRFACSERKHDLARAFNLPDLNRLDLQKQFAVDRIEMPIIFITGQGDVPMKVRAVKAGAVEFPTKAFGQTKPKQRGGNVDECD